MADYTTPLTIDKFVRFYDGQFLQDQDFIDEQKYRSSRDQLTRRTLHASGVAEGLTVYQPANSTFQVKVRAGVALDVNGRHIVQPKISDPIDLTEYAGRDCWLYVAYNQQAADEQSSDQGVAGDTRWQELPYFFASASLLGPEDSYSGTNWKIFQNEKDGSPPPILLAKLTIAADGNVGIDASVRLYSGLKLPGKEASHSPLFRSDAEGNVGLWLNDGDRLHERLSVTPAGNLGINKTNPTAALEIGSTLTASQNGESLVALKIDPTFVENGRSNIKKVGLLVSEGNVGIGTTTPSAKLDVVGTMQGDYLILNEQSDAGEGGELRLDGSNGENHIHVDNYFGHLRVFGIAADRQFQVHNAGATIAGNVGIGTTSPNDKLEVIDSDTTTNGGGITIRSASYAQLKIISDNYWSGIELRRDSAGSAGRPHIDFTNDLTSNYGVRLSAPTNNSFAIEGGNVGVGITTPEELLHVKSANDPTIKIQSDGSNKLSGKLSLRQSNDTGADIYYDGTNSVDALRFDVLASNSAEPTALSISNLSGKKGNVGIGTTTPNDRLEVVDPSTTSAGGMTIRSPYYAQLKIISENYWAGIELRRDSAGTAGRPHIDFTNDLTSNYGIRLSAPTNNSFAIEGGNVGIGTTSPATKLHISGGGDASLSSDGFLMLGQKNSTNIVIDSNEIMARNNNATSPLYIQNSGGSVQLGLNSTLFSRITFGSINIASARNSGDGWSTVQAGTGKVEIYWANQPSVAPIAMIATCNDEYDDNLVTATKESWGSKVAMFDQNGSLENGEFSFIAIWA